MTRGKNKCPYCGWSRGYGYRNERDRKIGIKKHISMMHPEKVENKENKTNKKNKKTCKIKNCKGKAQMGFNGLCNKHYVDSYKSGAYLE